MAENQENEQQDGLEEAAQGNGGGSSFISKLLSKDVLIPAAATAATAAAAGFAAKKAPDLKDFVSGQAKDGAEELGKSGAEGAKDALGSAGGPIGALAGKLTGGGSSGGKKKTRRLPIQRWTDVAVPVEEAFARWTEFEKFPEFMHRVQTVKQEEKNKLQWDEKIWFSRRQWEGEITDLRKNDRVAWKTTSGTSHSGVVSFHKLDAKLTRVLVTVDFQPTGMMEKMASGLRFVKRAVQADLARFKAYVELGDAEGLEYEAAPEKEESAKDDAQADAGDSGENGENGDNGDRENEREERESRRQERRGALSSR